MQSILDDVAPEVDYPAVPLLIGGLHGCHATYRNRRHQYYEVWFDMDDGYALNIIILTKGDILDVDAAAFWMVLIPALKMNNPIHDESSDSIFHCRSFLFVLYRSFITQ